MDVMMEAQGHFHCHVHSPHLGLLSGSGPSSQREEALVLVGKDPCLCPVKSHSRPEQWCMHVRVLSWSSYTAVESTSCWKCTPHRSYLWSLPGSQAGHEQLLEASGRSILSFSPNISSGLLALGSSLGSPPLILSLTHTTGQKWQRSDQLVSWFSVY